MLCSSFSGSVLILHLVSDGGLACKEGIRPAGKGWDGNTTQSAEFALNRCPGASGYRARMHIQPIQPAGGRSVAPVAEDAVGESGEGVEVPRWRS